MEGIGTIVWCLVCLGAFALGCGSLLIIVTIAGARAQEYELHKDDEYGSYR